MALSYPIFKNIDDLQNYYYPALGQMLNKIGSDEFAQTDTAGYFNNRYGGYLWINTNFEGNVFSLMPKIAYRRSGFRIVNSPVVLNQDTDDAAQHTKYGATVEGGKIAEAKIPAIHTVNYKPKVVQLPFGTSVVQEWLANNSEDDTAGSLESLRLFMGENFALNLALQIGKDASSEPRTGDYTGAGGTGPRDIETIDRIVSSDAEEDADGGTGDHWYNPWRNETVDRDSSTAFDSYVASATNGTIDSGNARLSKKIIINTLAKIKKAGGGVPTVAVANQEVVAQIQQLYEQNTRYAMGEKMVQFGVNGIETARGTGVGIVVASLYGIPLIESQHLNGGENDTSEIGRMYFLDTSARDSAGAPRMGVSIAIPPMYNEIGAVNGTAGGVLTLGEFANKGIYWSMMETIASRFVGHGKIRDIGE